MKELFSDSKPKLTSLFQNDHRYERSTSITTTLDQEEDIKKYHTSDEGHASTTFQTTKKTPSSADLTS